MRGRHRILPAITGIALLPMGGLASNVGSAGQQTRHMPHGSRANVPIDARTRTGTAGNGSGKSSRSLTTSTGIRRAQRFARRRQGVVAFAVLEEGRRPRGFLRTARFPSASVVKAMLLVATLRRADGRRLSETERSLLRSMITVSDNDAASELYETVGGRGLHRVAGAAGMRKFADVGNWADSQITAADQARLFLRIDRLVPAAHRRYARKLLSSIVSWQRWGIASVARLRQMRIFFKGGWRRGISHQVALLERGGERLALAVLTSGSPSAEYGEETIERIAKRVLRPHHPHRTKRR
jgi:beta-lactamase family protein